MPAFLVFPRCVPIVPKYTSSTEDPGALHTREVHNQYQVHAELTPLCTCVTHENVCLYIKTHNLDSVTAQASFCLDNGISTSER
jgi:hypothetical protein